MSKFPKLKSKAILSPMAGVTDVAFRALAKKYGAALTYTEFLNSTAIVRENRRTLELLKTDVSEKPVAVQLFGSSVDDVVKAAELIEDKFDIIDINCGCPAWKVIKTGSGSAMLNDPDKIADLIKRLTSAVKIPVTVKIRAGIDEKNINAIQVAKLAEAAGAAAIAIHGRTQKQGYSGVSDWKIIKKVKESVNIPVIGNGDITSPELFKKHLEESNVDYIMIARAAMNNPYIFKQIEDYLKTGSYKQKDKFVLFREYLTLTKKHKIPFPVIKNHAMNFTKGVVGGSKLRNRLIQCKSIKSLENALPLKEDI